MITRKEFRLAKWDRDNQLIDRREWLEELVGKLDVDIERLENERDAALSEIKEINRQLEYDYDDYAADYGDAKFHALRDEGKI